MKYTFPVQAVVKEAWQTVWSHKAFFALFSIVFVAINIFGNSKDTFWSLLFGAIAAIIWSYVQTGVGLAVADKKTESLSYKNLSTFFPGVCQLWEFLLVGIMCGLIFLGGLLLLVLPGIYFAFRLSLARYAYVDRNEGVMKALRYSWDITKDHFGTVVLVGFVSLGLLLVGMLALFVGLLVSYPLIIILQSKLYRALSSIHEGNVVAAEAVTETAMQMQPEELPAATVE